jgi:hypothetical protein
LQSFRATTRAQWAAITRANAIVGPAWRRSFAGGVVVVNPSMARATAQFGGHYLDGPGRPVPLSSSRLRARLFSRW